MPTPNPDTLSSAMKRPVTRTTAAAATGLNFPIVLVGLALIVTLTDGGDSVALLNLWSVWGFANTLVGQIGLLSASTDGLAWTDRRVLTRSLLFASAAALLLIPFRDRLFPDHAWWWLAGATIAGAAHAAGRQRGLMTAGNDGASTVVITMFENLTRVVLLCIVLALGGNVLTLAGATIAAPFFLTLAMQGHRLRSGHRNSRIGPTTQPTSISTGVLAGLPGVSAYAIVPGLTLLDEVADLEELAVAVSVLRGPLIVTMFASAWILEQLRRRQRSTRGLTLLTVTLVLAQLVVGGLVDPSSVVALVAQGACAGTALLAGYVVVLAESSWLAIDTWTPVIPLLAWTVFSAVLAATHLVDFVHPFVALTALVATISLLVNARSMRFESSP